MQLIQMPRGFGKSTTIVRLMMADTNSVCMVPSMAMAEQLAKQLFFEMVDAKERGLISPSTAIPEPKRLLSTRFITPHTVGSLRGRKIGKLYVEEIDAVLAAFIDRMPDLGTYTPPPDPRQR